MLQSKPNKTPLDRIPLVVTYQPGLPPLKRILEKHLPILHVSNRLSMAVRNPPLVAYHRPQNLKSLLIRAAIRKPLPSYRGNSRCDQPRCETCRHIKTVDRFKSSVTGRDYRVKATANCETSNVVHVIECNKCKLQYVWRNGECAPHTYQWTSVGYQITSTSDSGQTFQPN